MKNNQKKKILLRRRRHNRITAKIKGTSRLPRIALFKSSNHIYGQAIDDENGKTIVSQSDIKLSSKDLSSKEKDLSAKQQKAFAVGELLASIMKEKKISEAVLDRGGFKYHGRIKAFTDGLRKGGIKI